jgi:hypothetical protein
VFFQGARVTFVWKGLFLTNVLYDILRQTVGSPDMIVGQHGYWEVYAVENRVFYGPRKTVSQIIEKSQQNVGKVLSTLDRWTETKPLSSEYPNAYHRRRDDNANATEACHSKSPYKVWFTSFDKKFCTAANSSDGYLCDGTVQAKQLGWDVLDRSMLVDPETGEHQDAHPTTQALELELEMLLVLIQNVG